MRRNPKNVVPPGRARTFAFLAAMATALPALGDHDSYNWVGGHGNWSVPNNWARVPDGAPGPPDEEGDVAFIGPGFSPEVNFDAYFNPQYPPLGTVAVDGIQPGADQAHLIQSSTLTSLHASCLMVGVDGNMEPDCDTYGWVTQTAGQSTIGDLILGFYGRVANHLAHGTYDLGGTAELTAVSMSVGYGGAGQFNQTAGQVTVSSLRVGGSDGSGTYNLSGTGSRLTVNTQESIASGVDGTFNQTDGTHEVNGDLYVGWGGNGTYALGPAGELTVTGTESTEWIGGRFVQTGGKHTVRCLHLGAQGSSSTYDLLAGTLEAEEITSEGTFNHAAGSTLSVAKSFYNGRYGTATFSGVQIWADGSTFSNYGTATFNTDAGPAGRRTLTINAFGDYQTVFNATQHLVCLDAGATDGWGGNRTVVSPNGDTVVDTQTLKFTRGELPPGKLDMNDNDLILRHTDIDHGATKLADVTGYIRTGLNLPYGYWDGPGICSTAAKDDPGQVTALGVMNNDDGYGNPIYTVFSGEPLDQNCILVKYTYWGDNDLSGFVDLDTDFSLFVDGYNSGGTLHGWLWGDYNYDAVIDLDNDFSLFVTGLNNQGDPLSAREAAALRAQLLSTAAVPDPGAAPLLALAALSLLNRRCRKRR